MIWWWAIEEAASYLACKMEMKLRSNKWINLWEGIIYQCKRSQNNYESMLMFTAASVLCLVQRASAGVSTFCVFGHRNHQEWYSGFHNVTNSKCSRTGSNVSKNMYSKSSQTKENFTHLKLLSEFWTLWKYPTALSAVWRQWLWSIFPRIPRGSTSGWNGTISSPSEIYCGLK